MLSWNGVGRKLYFRRYWNSRFPIVLLIDLSTVNIIAIFESQTGVAISDYDASIR